MDFLCTVVRVLFGELVFPVSRVLWPCIRLVLGHRLEQGCSDWLVPKDSCPEGSP